MASKFYSLALFLEPHLSLIKSKSLYQLYHALRYEKEDLAIQMWREVEMEATKDYRLQKLIEKTEKVIRRLNIESF